MSRSAPSTASRKHYLIAIAFILISAVLRFYHLEDQSLWNDEMFSLDAAARSLRDIHPWLTGHYHHPPLFFYLAHGALALFGYSAWALRSTSALFGALTVGLAYVSARRLFGTTAGVAAGLMCLVAPFFLAYTQEGRPYALAAFLCLLSSYLLYLYLSEQNNRYLSVYTVITIALLYTHYWGVFVLAAQFSAVLLHNSTPSPPKKKPLWIAWCIIALSFLPGLLVLRHQDIVTPASNWFWVRNPSLKETYHLLTAFAGTYFNMASSILASPVALQVTGAFLVAVVFVASIVRAVVDRKNAAFRFIVVCFGGTLLIPFFISFVKPEVFLWYRYTVIAFPLLCVVISGLISDETLKHWTIARTAGWIVVAVFLIFGAVGDIHYFSGWQKGNARDVARYVDTVMREHDVKMLIRPRNFAPLLNYYYNGSARQYDEAYLDTPLGEIVDTARSFAYISLDIRPHPIRSYMDGHFDKLVERKFPGEAHMGIVVDVYQQKPDEDDDTTE